MILKILKSIAKTLLMCVTLLFVKIVKILKRKFTILLELWTRFQRANPTLRISWHLKIVFLEKQTQVLIHRTSKISFQKSFSKLPGKQPIVKSKQPVVTCFYCMKRDHSFRFCKIRKYFVPKGIMKWIPKGCEVSNDEGKLK